MTRLAPLAATLALALSTDALADEPAPAPTEPTAADSEPAQDEPEPLVRPLSPHPATGEPARFGVGLGSATLGGGLSGELRFTDLHSAQLTFGLPYVAVGESMGSVAYLGADYIRNAGLLTATRPGDLSWNVGGGLGVWLSSDPTDRLVGVSGLLGVQFAFAQVPVELALELRPGFAFAEDELLFMPLAFGGSTRWYF